MLGLWSICSHYVIQNCLFFLKKHRYLIVWQCLFFIPIRLNINAINRFNHSLDLWILMFQIRLVQTIFSIEILQLQSVLISFHINTFHFSLHINELNTVENSSQESNPVPTSILILAGRGSLRRCSGSFGSSQIYFRLITSGSVNSHSQNAVGTFIQELQISSNIWRYLYFFYRYL